MYTHFGYRKEKEAKNTVCSYRKFERELNKHLNTQNCSTTLNKRLSLNGLILQKEEMLLEFHEKNPFVSISLKAGAEIRRNSEPCNE